MTKFGPAWEGCTVEGEYLFFPEGRLHVSEIRQLPWLRASWAAELRRLRQQIERTGTQEAVFLTLEELLQIRAALALLDAKLPGRQLAPETPRKRQNGSN